MKLVMFFAKNEIVWNSLFLVSEIDQRVPLIESRIKGTMMVDETTL